MDIGKMNRRLRELREKRGLSQTQAAGLVHVGQRTYSDYERGVTLISIDRLDNLAKFYNVDLNYICGISDLPRPYPKR